MRITLIGMAGIGKSTWAARLEGAGFLRIDCDRMIAEELSPELNHAEDLIAALGAWMGLPWEPRYERRASQYQDLEGGVMSRVIRRLKDADPGNPVIVDTAGSVIYSGDEILEELGRWSTVVHLAAPIEVQRVLLEDYLKRPGPVLWHGMFQQRPDESNRDAVSRCYPALLEDRERRYSRWAHLSLDYSVHRRRDLTTQGFLELLENQGTGQRGKTTR